MEIPSDIAEEANQVTDDIFDETNGSWDWPVVERHIARALLAERGRATEAERDRVNAMWDRGAAASISTTADAALKE